MQRFAVHIRRCLPSTCSSNLFPTLSVCGAGCLGDCRARSGRAPYIHLPTDTHLRCHPKTTSTKGLRCPHAHTYAGKSPGLHVVPGEEHLLSIRARVHAAMVGTSKAWSCRSILFDVLDTCCSTQQKSASPTAPVLGFCECRLSRDLLSHIAFTIRVGTVALRVRDRAGLG